MTDAPNAGFGPWVRDLDPGERRARLRAMAALAHVFLGPRAALTTSLLGAEIDPAELQHALAELDRAPALPRRRLLATYGELAAVARAVAIARALTLGMPPWPVPTRARLK